MLRYSKGGSVDLLRGFECGVPVMDEFIHDSLASFLQEHSQYELYVAIEEGIGVVAMFVTSEGALIDREGEFDDIPYGKPWGYMDEDLQVQTGTMYLTLEIDYLAVRKDLRENGYGKEIIAELIRKARSNHCYFLTVDAYHTKNYSAIPFYEKQGFFALQEYSEDYDTLRMALRV